MKIESLVQDAIALLKELISIPSFSKSENRTAELLEKKLQESGCAVQRSGNNIWAKNKHYDITKPTLLLNSHHDTVKPNNSWTVDPFIATHTGDKIIGLGANDAGASLVSLFMAFRYFYSAENLPFNIIFAATAEEEISGAGGIESVYSKFGPVDFAIVGEPTQMNVAIAEKGLLVLDCISHGRSGHAAREEGENAIYSAIKDIEWFNTFQFEKSSPWLGNVKMSVTMIESGTQHNVIPDTCKFTVDVRVNEMYSPEEILSIIKQQVKCDVVPRSIRIRSSGIIESHPLIVTAKSLNRKLYGSPATSDQAFISAPSIKMGPGDSARSHTADEYILIEEIQNGIEEYILFINTLTQFVNRTS